MQLNDAIASSATVHTIIPQCRIAGAPPTVDVLVLAITANCGATIRLTVHLLEHGPAIAVMLHHTCATSQSTSKFIFNLTESCFLLVHFLSDSIFTARANHVGPSSISPVPVDHKRDSSIPVATGSRVPTSVSSGPPTLDLSEKQTTEEYVGREGDDEAESTDEEEMRRP